MAKVQIPAAPGCSGCATVEGMLDRMKVKYGVIDATKMTNTNSRKRAFSNL